MDICERNRNVAISRWKKIHELEKSKINADDIKLARLCGFLAGDGSLIVGKEKSRNAMRYIISFYPDVLELAQLYVDTFSQIYSKVPTIREEINHFSVNINSKVVASHLKELSTFGTLNWEIPKFIFESRECKIEFIRAFYDCEGYVGKNRIDVQSVNKSGIEEIKFLLASLGVSSNLYMYVRKNENWNTNYILVISEKENIIKFARLIGFNHPVKRMKINTYAGIA